MCCRVYGCSCAKPDPIPEATPELLGERTPIFIAAEGRPTFTHDWSEIGGLTRDEIAIVSGFADTMGIWRDINSGYGGYSNLRVDPPFARLIVSWYETGAYRNPELSLAKFLGLVFAEVEPRKRLTIK